MVFHTISMIFLSFQVTAKLKVEKELNALRDQSEGVVKERTESRSPSPTPSEPTTFELKFALPGNLQKYEKSER